MIWSSVDWFLGGVWFGQFLEIPWNPNVDIIFCLVANISRESRCPKGNL